MKKCWIIVLLYLFTVACSGDPDSLVLSESDLMSDTAKQYLNSVPDIMQNHSINKYKIEWESFRAQTIEFAGDAQPTKDTYPAIWYAITNLGDNHSFFREPQSSPILKNIIQSGKDVMNIHYNISAHRVDENIGYIRIPGFMGEDMGDFANAIRDLICEIGNT
ncbi:MAG: hypothetical protein GY863_06735 [bacterium]|nr:hypothetical protein [bacterium]